MMYGDYKQSNSVSDKNEKKLEDIKEKILCYIKEKDPNEATVKDLFKVDNGYLYTYADQLNLSQNQLRKFYDRIVKIVEGGERINLRDQEKKQWTLRSKEELLIMLPLMYYSLKKAERKKGETFARHMDNFISTTTQTNEYDEFFSRLKKLQTVYQSIIAYSKRD